MDSTKFFAEKIGDKISLEIEITGNPDDVVNILMKSLNKGTDLFDGAFVSQILFKGVDIEERFRQKKEELRKAMEQILE